MANHLQECVVALGVGGGVIFGVIGLCKPGSKDEGSDFNVVIELSSVGNDECLRGGKSAGGTRQEVLISIYPVQVLSSL